MGPHRRPPPDSHLARREGWVCDVLLEPGPPTAREGCFLSMDPGLVTMKDAWTLFPLHPEHDAVVPPKEEIHVMAQGHLQGGTPSLWGFTFQEAACDQWVLRPRVWTAHSPIKMTVYNCGHKPLHIGPSVFLKPFFVMHSDQDIVLSVLNPRSLFIEKGKFTWYIVPIRLVKNPYLYLQILPSSNRVMPTLTFSGPSRFRSGVSTETRT